MKRRPTDLLLQAALSALPIFVSLVIAAVLILVVGSDPRAVFEKVWEGAFRNTRSFAQVVNFWIPLTLVSVGLVVTFTAGLWNIGAEGQMIMGALFASAGALTLPDLPPLIFVPIELGLAMLGGVFWALIVGVLKTYLGVHEIFGGVALNFLAITISVYMIAGPLAPPGGGSAHETDMFPKNALLPPMSESFNVSLLALVIVLVSIVAVILALRGTRWGLQLRATGKNSRSALLLGVPTNRSALSAFVVCGMCAGLAGSYRVLFTFGNLPQLVSGGIGFLGLLVVLLVSIRALWVPFVAFAFAAILGGSTRLKIALQLDASLAGVIQGLLVLVVMLFNGVRQRIHEVAETRAPLSDAVEEMNQMERIGHE